MITRNDIEIFVTAGGKSTRMGQDKGLMIIDGKPMLLHLTDMLLQNHLTFTLIANFHAYQKFGFRMVNDLIPEKGPMGALHTAFHYANKEYVLLLGCDTPFFSAEALFRLVDRVMPNGVTVASVMTKINPLHAIYHQALQPQVSTCIAKEKLKMQEFILQSPHSIVVMDDLAEKHPEGFINMNEPNDVAI
ncbi:MAG: molybdenum cofactor guanylyltransferase [Chitinophagales bacterium]